MKLKIKKGDTVVMLGGKDRGKTGAIAAVDPKVGKIKVTGLNMVKRHMRPKAGGAKGQIISMERWVHVASVAPVNKDTGKAARVGWQMGTGDASTKVRIDRKTKTTL
jgi:large subunit ribosomal protein L24